MFEDIGDLDDDLSSLLVPDLDLGSAGLAGALGGAIDLPAKAPELAAPDLDAAGPSSAPLRLLSSWVCVFRCTCIRASSKAVVCLVRV